MNDDKKKDLAEIDALDISENTKQLMKSLMEDGFFEHNKAYNHKKLKEAVKKYDKEATEILSYYFSQFETMPPVSGLLLFAVLEKFHGEIIDETDDEHLARRKQTARKAINARHNKAGGSRDMKRQIQARWATGHYSTRDICAEEEYQDLGYKSFGAARKALQNTPKPEKIT